MAQSRSCTANADHIMCQCRLVPAAWSCGGHAARMEAAAVMVDCLQTWRAHAKHGADNVPGLVAESSFCVDDVRQNTAALGMWQVVRRCHLAPAERASQHCESAQKPATAPPGQCAQSPAGFVEADTIHVEGIVWTQCRGSTSVRTTNETEFCSTGGHCNAADSRTALL